MFVLGIDPGLTTTGFGVLHKVGHSIKAVAMGVIKTDPSADVSQRLLGIHKDLAGVIDETHPDAMAIEQVFVNRNLVTASGVARAGGVAILAAAQAGVEVAEYSPSAVKAAVTGNGRANKSQMQTMLCRRLGLASPPRPADAADALAIALCHLQTHAGRKQSAGHPSR